MNNTIAHKLNVDVFDFDSCIADDHGATEADLVIHLDRAINFLLDHARETGRDAWGDFNGTMLKATPSMTSDEVGDNWMAARR